LLTRSIGQRGPKAARYIRHTPGGAQAAGCIYLSTMCADALRLVNPGLVLAVTRTGEGLHSSRRTRADAVHVRSLYFLEEIRVWAGRDCSPRTQRRCRMVDGRMLDATDWRGPDPSPIRPSSDFVAEAVQSRHAPTTPCRRHVTLGAFAVTANLLGQACRRPEGDFGRSPSGVCLWVKIKKLRKLV
jgi:hypothetical protein